MKREELKDLGLSEDQIDKVMASHGKDIGGLQSQVTNLTTERDSLKDQAAESTKTIEGLKKQAKGNEDAQKAIEEWQQKAEAAQQSLATTQKNNAIELALRDAGARNAKAVGALLDQDTIKFEDGKLSGLKEQLEAVKKDNDFLFQPEKPNESKPKNTPTITVGGNPDPKSSPDESIAARVAARLSGENE